MGVAVHGPTKVRQRGREAQRASEHLRKVALPRTEPHRVEQARERRGVDARNGQPAKVSADHKVREAGLTTPPKFVQNGAVVPPVHGEEYLLTRIVPTPPQGRFRRVEQGLQLSLELAEKSTRPKVTFVADQSRPTALVSKHELDVHRGNGGGSGGRTGTVMLTLGDRQA